MTKLSNAIRRGSKGTKQGFHMLKAGPDACDALGAAYRGLPPGGRDPNIKDELFYRWPALYNLKRVECPECDYVGVLFDVITLLNDKHRWSRRQITEWLESEGL